MAKDTFDDRDNPRFNDRETFMLTVVMRLSDMLDATVGTEQTQDALAMVAGMLASDLCEDLLGKNAGETLDPDQVAIALVDLERRIGGGFSVVSVDEDRIVFHNSRCPFGHRVRGREALCNITAGLFSRVAERNLGRGQTEIAQSIAHGDGHCAVVVRFGPPAR